jgi:hypothetical protein
MANVIDISPRAFLKAAFPDYNLYHYETPLISRPVSWLDKEGVTKHSYRQSAWSQRANPFIVEGGWLYCISTVMRQERPRRRLKDLRHAFVLPLDDIGTKATEPSISPSYILETSPGNFQWGYFIDPYSVIEFEGQAYLDASMLALAEAGFSDPGCRSASRMVKLPEAIHKSGFVTRCVHWEPDAAFELHKLVEKMFGLTPDTRRFNRRKPSYTTLERKDIEDPILEWLSDSGQLRELNDRGYAVFRCPWWEEHSEGKNDEAGYSPLDYVTTGRHFYCYHGSCVGRTWNEFTGWVAEQDGPVLEGWA